MHVLKILCSFVLLLLALDIKLRDGSVPELQTLFIGRNIALCRCKVSLTAALQLLHTVTRKQLANGHAKENICYKLAGTQIISKLHSLRLIFPLLCFAACSSAAQEQGGRGERCWGHAAPGPCLQMCVVPLLFNSGALLFASTSRTADFLIAAGPSHLLCVTELRSGNSRILFPSDRICGRSPASLSTQPRFPSLHAMVRKEDPPVPS